MDGRVLTKLEEWQRKAGAPPELVEFYHRLLLRQAKAEERLGLPGVALTGEAASERLGRGLPLIRPDDLELDWSLLREVFGEVVAAFADCPTLFGTVPGNLIGPGTSHLLLEEAVRAWFKGERLPEAIVAGGISEHLLEVMIQGTLKPFLAGYSKALLGYVEQESWRRGYCPICGGNPDYAYLDKELGARWLLCHRCDTGWLFQRLQCPYCGSQDQNALAYYTDEFVPPLCL
ncbi:formate dehydrogenase accessory protein FdhE [Chloroflexota bacterium]